MLCAQGRYQEFGPERPPSSGHHGCRRGVVFSEPDTPPPLITENVFRARTFHHRSKVFCWHVLCVCVCVCVCFAWVGPKPGTGVQTGKIHGCEGCPRIQSQGAPGSAPDCINFAVSCNGFDEREMERVTECVFRSFCGIRLEREKDTCFLWIPGSHGVRHALRHKLRRSRGATSLNQPNSHQGVLTSEQAATLETQPQT